MVYFRAPVRLTIILAAIVFAGVPVISSAEEITHVVKEGETLYAISRRYGTSVMTLMQANRLDNPDKLLPGTRIVIPDMYEIKKGDTLYGIARRYGCDVSVLLTMNNIDIEAVLKPGDLITIPQGTSSPVETPAPPVRQTSPRPAVIRPTDVNAFWPHPGAQKTLEGKLEGISFEGKPGDDVLSVASGKVVWVGPYRGFGRVVFIQSDRGYIYVYAGNEDILVSVGNTIHRGQKIGTMGVNPYEGKSSVYFIVYKDGKPVRPENAPRI